MVTLSLLYKEIGELLEKTPSLGNFPVEDPDNPGYFITRVVYKKETDDLVFECAEE